MPCGDGEGTLKSGLVVIIISSEIQVIHSDQGDRMSAIVFLYYRCSYVGPLICLVGGVLIHRYSCFILFSTAVLQEGAPAGGLDIFIFAPASKLVSSESVVTCQVSGGGKRALWWSSRLTSSTGVASHVRPDVMWYMGWWHGGLHRRR